MMDDVLPSFPLGKLSGRAARHLYEKQECRDNDV